MNAPLVHSLDARTWYVDVCYQGVPRRIACGVLETDAGLLLVDPGPTVSYGTLLKALEQQGASVADVHALLLTHIHLDHAGATGTMVQQKPDLQVYVHELGARHMIDPERLLRSAGRLYGDQMDALWGDFLPVPEGNVHVLQGVETLAFGGRRLEVAYTPGHAVHHVSFLDRQTGIAFVGDTVGMKVHGTDAVLPVTPPPDVDLEAWYHSLDLLRDWSPDRLFLTHFGPADRVGRALDAMQHGLHLFAGLVRASLDEDASEAERAAAVEQQLNDRLLYHLPPNERGLYERYGQQQAGWYGFARYWRKKWEAARP